MKKLTTLSTLLCCLLFTLAMIACGELPEEVVEETAVSTRNPAALYIDASQTLGPISPRVYGTNYGPWLTVPVDVLDEYQQSGLTFLRFPGGRWGDENNIRETQIDQLMSFTAMINGEATISARLLDGTPEQAAELVRYVNLEKGYNVRYWSLGNEPSLYATLQNSSEWDTAHFNREWRKIAAAMKAVDPDILLLGPELHQYTANEAANPKDANGKDWMREFLLANGDLVDVVTIHRYPFPKDFGEPMTPPAELLASSEEWDAIIPKLRTVIEETTGRNLPIGVTEVNSNWSDIGGGEATPDSLLNAIWWTDALGRMIQQRVDIVTHFALQSKPGSAGWGLLARTDVRPSYYVYQLYKRFGTELLATDSPDQALSVFAAVREDNRLTAIVVNRSSDPKRVPLQIVGATVGKTADLWLLDAEHQATALDEVVIDELVYPPYSASLLVFTLDDWK